MESYDVIMSWLRLTVMVTVVRLVVLAVGVAVAVVKAVASIMEKFGHGGSCGDNKGSGNNTCGSSFGSRCCISCGG